MPKRLRGQKGFSEMMKTAGEERTKESKRARAALEDPRCTDLLLELTSWIDRRFGLMIDQSQPPEDVACRKVGDFAAQLLKERQRKVRKLARKVDKLDPQELHELRIRIKKLRYVVDFSKTYGVAQASRNIFRNSNSSKTVWASLTMCSFRVT